ncbi:MAG: hypothetical protein HY017_06555 [Betaproteobacteria bacterium]|nr:hypothetical protein [Betaproteobacteria bacterium]
MSEKLRALLKFGMKVHVEMRLRDSETAFRQVADSAQGEDCALPDLAEDTP